MGGGAKMWRNNANLGATMEQMAVLAENLRALVDAEAMDMKALCRRIGVTKESMMRWMTVPPVQSIKKNKLAQLAAYFGVTEEWLLEPHTEGAAEPAMRRAAPGRKPVAEMVQRMADAERANLARDETCQGCRYYGYLDGWAGGGRCCDYTFMTGLIRRNPPDACEVKEIGPMAIRRDMYKAYRDAEARQRQETALCSRCRQRPAAPGYKQCDVCLEYDQERRGARKRAAGKEQFPGSEGGKNNE